MLIRFTSGGKAGQVMEVNGTPVVQAWIASGRAVVVNSPDDAPASAEEAAAEVEETPELPKGRGRRKAEEPETR